MYSVDVKFRRLRTEASITSEAMMDFRPVSDFIIVPEIFQTSWKVFPISPFQQKNFNFHPLKFLMTFFRIIPYFRCFSTFPPDFVKFTCFYIVCVFRFPSCLTMMHLCITQCTHWTPLVEKENWSYPSTKSL